MFRQKTTENPRLKFIHTLKNHRLLCILIIIYLATASFYAINTPLYEVSDELWHYPLVEHLANNGLSLPPQDLDDTGPWLQQGNQPPLYHLIAAILTAWIDTRDMDEVRRLNPHPDFGMVRPDGNAAVVMHNWEREQFPWTGTALATYLARFFSVALSTLTVIVTYITAMTVFPKEPALALGAAGINAFLPMFLFISSAVNNDNLSNLTGNLLVLLLLITLNQWQTVHWRHYAIIGVVAGAGILSKLSIGFLLPLVALTLLLVALRRKDWKPFIIGGLISGGITILIAGWWYLRNYQLYADPTGLDRFLDIVGRRAVPADLEQLWTERDSFLQAFWGMFGWMSVPMPQWIYTALNVFGGIGLLSSLIYLVRQVALRRWGWQQWTVALLTVLWPVITFISYLQWTSITPASQGRLIFVALSSILLWMVWGYLWLFPPKIRPVIAGSIVSVFFVLAWYAPINVIRPAYAPPSAVEVLPETYVTTLHQPNGTDSLSLFAPTIQTPEVRPGDYVLIDIIIQAEQALSQDWSVFVHLASPEDVIIAQRDTYPNSGQGSMLTTEMTTPFAWDNFMAVRIPEGAYSPMTLDVLIGFYNIHTQERMVNADGLDRIHIGQVELIPRTNLFSVPNHIVVNFGGQIELLGYELSTLNPQVGDTVELTLYWRARRFLTDDWTVFANIIDPDTLTKYADSNAMPVNWTRPTSSWTIGEVIVDTHTLTLYDDAVPGIYQIEVGLYRQTDSGDFQRLTVRNTNDTFIYLSRVRIMPEE
jgi:4-amino-4-deoxy-L-arabinose transferase-like glycosyltransferase